MSALKYQVSGDHYKGEYQPVELFCKLRLNAFQANVVKYIHRYKRKNGVQDLKKAKHYCELALELKPKNFTKYFNSEYIAEETLLFLNKNNIYIVLFLVIS